MSEPVPVRELLAKARQRLAEARCDSPALDAEILLAHTLAQERTWLYMHPQEKIDQEQLAAFNRSLQRRVRREPVAYIVGRKAFFGLEFQISRHVLIPRPETEELVRWIIEGITHPRPLILEIGTGSGCIALALKKQIPGSQVMATDVNEAALLVASRNALKLELDLPIIQHDILDINPPKDWPRADIIASNPPYIPISEKITMAPHITSHEPPGALFVPDENPLLFYFSIASFARQQLKKGGQLYLEIHEKFGSEVIDLLQQHGFQGVELRQDINGKDRMIKAIRP